MANSFAAGIWTATGLMYGAAAVTWAYCSGKAWVVDRRNASVARPFLALGKSFRKVITLGGELFMRLTKRAIPVNFSDVIRDCAGNGEQQRSQGNPVSDTHNVIPFRKAR